MNILLVDPSVGTGDGLNTGLGWLSASLEAKGHGARVLDMVNRSCPAPDRLLLDTVRSLSPDSIGFCVHSITYQAALDLVTALKPSFSGPVIFGGPQLAFERKQCLLAAPEVDYALVGEAEESLPELLTALEDKQPLDTIAGLIWRQDGKVVENPFRPVKAVIDDLPFPDYRLFGLKSLRAPYSIMTSRGCPYGCIFCNTFMSGSKWRPRPIENVMAELDFAEEQYQIREFMVQEPVFNLYPERVVDFCRALQKRRTILPWFSPSGLRADRITADMLAAMRDAGCQEIKIGVESLVPEVFDAVNKGTTIEKIEEACRIIKASGFRLRGSFIVGLPHDSYQNTMASYRRAKELGFDEMDWSLLIPYPGTAVYDWVKEEGTLYHDYRRADQCAFQSTSPYAAKVAFDTPDFSAAERLRAFTDVCIRSGQYFFDRSRTYPQILFQLAGQILRHDPGRLPWHLYEIARRAMNKLRRGAERGDRYVFNPIPGFADSLD